MVQTPNPTPYPDVNAVLHRLFLSVQTVLGSHWVGMYVHGSLVRGDFDPQRSDIDFVVVTAAELSDETFRALEAMHAHMRASGLPWAAKLEGAYIPQHALRRYDPAHARHPWLGVDGHFAVEQLGSDWVIQCHVLRGQGVVLAGPAPRALIDPILPDDLRRAQRATLQEWWVPQLHDTTRLQSGEYQAYAILAMCRALYTLQRGTVVSKPVAARWAQQTLGERWAALIGRALAWRHDVPFDALDETLALLRYTLEHAQRFAMPLRGGRRR
jgi:hypothetical protein